MNSNTEHCDDCNTTRYERYDSEGNRIQTPEHRDPEAVFAEAIESGRLSDEPGTEKYAGRWMYMGTVDGVDTFKNSDTRQYLPNES